MLAGYDRLAGMTAKGYLRTYYDSAGKTWRYPPQGGYQLTPEGQPVKMQLSLFAGQRIDRFGSEFGGYLSPEGTPYEARGIPPQSLDSKTAPATCNYSRYRVLQTIPVYSGPIAPALGQPGFGLQYVLDAAIFPGSPAGPQRRLPRGERLPGARRRTHDLDTNPVLSGLSVRGVGMTTHTTPRRTP